MSEKSKISIIGCGWLGLPLAAHLVKIGHFVCGTVTQKEGFYKLLDAGIKPFQLHLSEETQLLPELSSIFWESDIFILTLPPKNPETYPNSIQLVLSVLKAQKRNLWLLYTSSTGVYGKGLGLINEKSECNPDRPSSAAVLKVEKLIQNASEHIEYSILRLAGLVGGERQSGRFFAGKKNLESGSSPVNLIHLEDCIAVISSLLEKNIRPALLNVCATEHPVHRDFYPIQAIKLGLEPPTYGIDNPGTDYKIIDNGLLINLLEYSFLFPDPLEFP